MILCETERLIIRHWSPKDLAPFQALVADPEVMKYIGDGSVLSPEKASDYIQNCISNIQKIGWARFAVELKSEHSLIGFCGFAHYNGELDFGWRYAKKHWGKGYATEAAKAVLELGVKRFQFPRIVCFAFTENKASIRIMEKIGLRFEEFAEFNGKEVVKYVL